MLIICLTHAQCIFSFVRYIFSFNFINAFYQLLHGGNQCCMNIFILFAIWQNFWVTAVMKLQVVVQSYFRGRSLIIRLNYEFQYLSIRPIMFRNCLWISLMHDGAVSCSYHFTIRKSFIEIKNKLYVIQIGVIPEFMIPVSSTSLIGPANQKNYLLRIFNVMFCVDVANWFLGWCCHIMTSLTTHFKVWIIS